MISKSSLTVIQQGILLLGCALVALVFLSGCSLFESGAKSTSFPTLTSDVTESRLRAGDQLQIRLDIGGQQTTQGPQNSEVVIDENGEISLPLIGRIKAEGSTASELAERIQANYVPRFYVRCNATVLVPLRFFYVSGEVRNPSRFAWNEDMTLLKAISTAGGFTDYSSRRKVELTRGSERHVFDIEAMQRNPSLDVPIRPGDTVMVPRSIF